MADKNKKLTTKPFARTYKAVLDETEDKKVARAMGLLQAKTSQHYDFTKFTKAALLAYADHLEAEDRKAKKLT